MASPRNLSGLTEVVDPPRDGEFFFEWPDERAGDARGWSHWILRHPVRTVAIALAVGVPVVSVLLRM